MQHLTHLVVIGDDKDISDDMKKEAEEVGLTLLSFEAVRQAGAEELKEVGGMSLELPNADTVYMLSYTSGTTGDPKGVKLTHKMVLNGAQAINARYKDHPEGIITEKDCYMSYLPLSHSFEQVMQA